MENVIILYTLEEAKEILKKEAKQKREFKKKLEAERKARKKEIIKKFLYLIGISLILVIIIAIYSTKNKNGHYESVSEIQSDGSYYIWVEEE